MSIEIPAWGAGEMIVRAERKLRKAGWKRSANQRLDCIEKEFDGVLISTIWAGHQLFLNGNRVGETDELKAHVHYDDPAIKKASEELLSIFEPIIKRNRKRWDADIKQYEQRQRTDFGIKDFVFTRSEKYGV